MQAGFLDRLEVEGGGSSRTSRARTTVVTLVRIRGLGPGCEGLEGLLCLSLAVVEPIVRVCRIGGLSWVLRTGEEADDLLLRCNMASNGF